MMKLKLRNFEQREIFDLFESDRKSKKILLNKSQSVNNLEMFEELFNDSLKMFYHDFSIAVNETENIEKYAGYFFTYDYRGDDNNCKLYVYSTDENLAYEILIFALRNLFCKYPLKKIFIWVRDDDCIMLSAVCRLGCIREALLKEYIFADARYADVYVFGIYRNEIENGS